VAEVTLSSSWMVTSSIRRTRGSDTPPMPRRGRLHPQSPRSAMVHSTAWSQKAIRCLGFESLRARHPQTTTPIVNEFIHKVVRPPKAATRFMLSVTRHNGPASSVPSGPSFNTWFTISPLLLGQACRFTFR
jgi:hypothetical protein